MSTGHADSTVALARELIGRRSLTPDDAGCQDVIAERLGAAGFEIERLPSGNVSNLWATHGHGSPVLALAGHTDVVPPGPASEWRSDPFEPVIEDGILYGRGAADMKGALAAMIEAAAAFVREQPQHPGTLALLVTSDEEGKAREGTRHVIEELERRAIHIDHCIVGEASSIERAGDEIRIGRRGSLSCHVTVAGVQGHVAYPEHTDNAAHHLVAALAELVARDWPAGHSDFPPLSFQISNMAAGTGAVNVVPGQATALFNFRYPPPIQAGVLQEMVEELFTRHAEHHSITWRDGGRPFLSPEGALRRAVVSAVEAELGQAPACTTGGGTSDGRFIAPTGTEVVELGPVRHSIHKVNEHVALADLTTLRHVYADVLARVLLERRNVPHRDRP